MTQGNPLPWRYRLYGWLLASARPLPLLQPADPGDGGDPDVEVRFGPVPPVDPASRVEHNIFIPDPATGLVEGTNGIRVLVEAGRVLTVDAPASVDGAELHTWLMGPAMGLLCHQRGRPPLHACVVEIGGRAVALAGRSGAGKSTTARALVARGHRLLSDDQALVDAESLLVAPGFPSMKLWSDAARHAGDAVEEGLRVIPGIDKYHLPMAGAFQAAPVPLALVLSLRHGGGVDRPTLEALPFLMAAGLLGRLVFRPALARAVDGERASFRWAARLARRVPVRVLHRPDSLGQVGAIADMVGQLVRDADLPAARPRA